MLVKLSFFLTLRRKDTTFFLIVQIFVYFYKKVVKK